MIPESVPDKREPKPAQRLQPPRATARDADTITY